MRKYLPTLVVACYGLFLYIIAYIDLLLAYTLALPFRLAYGLMLDVMRLFLGKEFNLITPAGTTNFITKVAPLIVFTLLCNFLWIVIKSRRSGN